jgi:excisionase family DNA binding protein
VSDFAKRIALGERTVRRLLAEGRIPSARVGRRILVPVEPALLALRLPPCSPVRAALGKALAAIRHERGRRGTASEEDLPELDAAQVAIERALLAMRPQEAT